MAKENDAVGNGALHYTGSGLDRVGHLRRDDSWLATKKGSGQTRVLPVWRSRNLVGGIDAEGRVTGDAPALVALDINECWSLAGEQGELVLLGEKDETVWFALDISHLEDPLSAYELKDRGEFVDLRLVGAVMNRAAGAAMAFARGILTWHRRHRFCGFCGSPTESTDAGHVRVCQNSECATQHFPRTDPAVIMLVHKGDKCLLGRTGRLPPGMHSTLAGFVEPGETLEEAVAREVLEETNIVVRDPVYRGSQPWPFPANIMVGFFAEATTEEITVDTNELEDARWYTRDELLNSPEDESFRMPRRDSIARHLIDGWLAGDAG